MCGRGRAERWAYPLQSLWTLRNIYHIQLKPHVYVWEYIKCHLPNHLPCYKLRRHQQCCVAKEHSAVFQFDIKWVLLPNSSYKHEKNSCKPSGGADGLGGFPTRALSESYRVYIFFAVQSGRGRGCSWGEQTFTLSLPCCMNLCEVISHLGISVPPPVKWGQKQHQPHRISTGFKGEKSAFL